MVQQYRAALEQKGLAPSSINLRLAAIRKLASEAADNGLLGAEQASAIARVKGARRRGVRVGNWLTREQAQALLDAPDAGTVKGKRDRAVLALLIGCGLRRSEIAALGAGDIEQRDGRWVIVDLEGKGNRLRTVPVPAWVKTAIDEWTTAAVIREGKLFRSLNKGGAVWGDGITEKVVWWIVQEYARGDRGRAPRPARPAPHLRQAMPRRRRRPRTDSVSAGPCEHPDHRAVPGFAPEPEPGRQRQSGAGQVPWFHMPLSRPMNAWRDLNADIESSISMPRCIRVQCGGRQLALASLKTSAAAPIAPGAPDAPSSPRRNPRLRTGASGCRSWDDSAG